MLPASTLEERATISPAIRAFDAVASRFDARFGDWRSVAAQRNQVRRQLERAFPPGARVLEIGGGTGEDAHWLAARGREVLLTDGAPSMVRIAREKLRSQRIPEPRVCSAEGLGHLAAERELAGQAPFDGAFSNFAALNCVDRLGTFAAGLARLLRPGAPALLVLFGTLCPGELIVQLARGDTRAAVRRRERGPVPARLGGRDFTVRYHTSAEVQRAMSPWFELRRRVGIGVFVPPSAAEPWISEHPALVRMLDGIDRVASRALAPLGDHVLYWFERTSAPGRGQGADAMRGGGWGVGSSRLRDTAAFRACSPSPSTPHFPPDSAAGARVPAPMTSSAPDQRRRFRRDYAEHRASEGRGALDARTLPYVTSGPLARQWEVRARSWEAFEHRVLQPAQRRADVRAAGPLRVLDLGAGNGWLAHRAALAGAEALALDVRDDRVDGLGATPASSPIERVVASFESIPLSADVFDVVVFNAALHYAEDLAAALREARRVARVGGRIVVLDSPFYRTAEQGEAMVRAKRSTAERQFGDRTSSLLALAFVEYLTPQRLADASRDARLGAWRRHRVRYPLWYELRGVRALVRRERTPSRFDLWESVAT